MPVALPRARSIDCPNPGLRFACPGLLWSDLSSVFCKTLSRALLEQG